MSALHDLAEEAGLQVHWEDAAGEPRLVSDESLRLVLSALDLPASSAAEIGDSRRRLATIRAEANRSFVTSKIGEEIPVPEGLAGEFVLELENGERRSVDLKASHIAPIERPGYHRLRHSDGEMIIAVAPKRCLGVEDIAASDRVWGVSAQLPSLRGERKAGFGDFGTLAEAAGALAAAGADLLAISPVHALFPADPRRFSPYAPSSRRFLNALFADPAMANGARNERDDGGELIDWEEALPRRLKTLRALFDAMDPPERERIAQIDRLPREEVRTHALFNALHQHFHAEKKHGWQSWPAEYQRPDSEASQGFADKHEQQVAFFAWLHGLADKSLAMAHRTARDAGMVCGIVTDLAVGIDPGGADVWARPHAFLEGLSVGAPPDLLGPEGQDWGLTTFNPLTLHADHFRAFRETVAAAMAHAGGVRIDHILGLRRVWVVPHGRASSEGCYLAMPQGDLTNILALESWRNRCIVIGEDLGTVPEGFRDEMANSSIHGMRVLWFERDEDGAYTDPAGWDRKAAAMTSTHDLPTLAGWWQGRDIDWTWQIGRKSRFASLAEETADRSRERARLWARIADQDTPGGDPHDQAEPFVSAAISHIAGSACEIAMIPLEDLFGMVEQPNLPGTLDEHPNWRRRLPDSVATLLERPAVSKRVAVLRNARK